MDNHALIDGNKRLGWLAKPGRVRGNAVRPRRLEGLGREPLAGGGSAMVEEVG